jgi:hypothetical protein
MHRYNTECPIMVDPTQELHPLFHFTSLKEQPETSLIASSQLKYWLKESIIESKIKNK